MLDYCTFVRDVTIDTNVKVPLTERRRMAGSHLMHTRCPHCAQYLCSLVKSKLSATILPNALFDHRGRTRWLDPLYERLDPNGGKLPGLMIVT